jgi:hypothetical protein
MAYFQERLFRRRASQRRKKTRYTLTAIMRDHIGSDCMNLGTDQTKVYDHKTSLTHISRRKAWNWHNPPPVLERAEPPMRAATLANKLAKEA